VDAIGEQLGLANDTTTQGCWCVRVGGGYARLTMTEARPQHKLTYVCREGRTVNANANGGVELFRPLYREESCRYQTTHAGK